MRRIYCFFVDLKTFDTVLGSRLMQRPENIGICTKLHEKRELSFSPVNPKSKEDKIESIPETLKEFQ